MLLLVVENNAVMARSLGTSLRADGQDVEIVATAAEALCRLARPDVDAVVLDLDLPERHALAALTSLRSRGIQIPVIAMTTSDAVAVRIEALDHGADDCVVKPFDHSELVARLRALLRRAAGPRWAPRSCNGLVFQDDDLQVSIGAAKVALSPREHALLGFFLRRRGEAISRPEILLRVFGYQFETGTNLVNVHIAHLRRKIGRRAVEIDTVRGFGYRLRSAESDVGSSHPIETAAHAG